MKIELLSYNMLSCKVTKKIVWKEWKRKEKEEKTKKKRKRKRNEKEKRINETKIIFWDDNNNIRSFML